MSNRVNGWTDTDAAVFLVFSAEEESYNELIFMNGEYTPGWDFDYMWSGYFTIGGKDNFGRDDDTDIAPIYLSAGDTYSFIVGQQNPNGWSWLSPDLSLYDADGYLMRTQPGSDAYSEPYEASLINFMPENDGWFYLSINAPYAWNDSGVVLIGGVDNQEVQDVVVDEVVDEVIIADDTLVDETPVVETAYIIDPDTSNYDNAIWSPQGFVVDAEDAQLYRTYMGALGRLPDKNGFEWWADQIEWGDQTLPSMAAGFVNSDEFISNTDTNENGTVSSTEFVTHMYEEVFGRSPDQAGFDFWVERLERSESTQGDVLVSMTQSNEYIDQTLDTVADYLFI